MGDKIKRPRVMHIHFWADIRNEAGSVEKVITAFAAFGVRFEHVVACCPEDGASLSPFEYQGFSVLPFCENKLMNRVLNKILGLKAFTYPDLVQKINALRPDILHFHNRQEVVDSIVKRLQYRPKVLVHYHRHFLMPVIPSLADKILCVSHRTAAYILEKTQTQKPYHVIFNPLSLTLIKKSIDLLASTRPTNTVPIILFGGGGDPVKGGKELIEAFKKLAPGCALLMLAGRGSELLLPEPSRGISALGSLSAGAFFDLLYRSDIVAMPSYDEGFGMLAQEAMVLKRLLVVSNTGGVAEFTDERSAIPIIPRDVDSIEHGLRTALALLSAPHDLDAKLDLAYQRVNAFHPERLIHDLEKVYEGTLER